MRKKLGLIFALLLTLFTIVPTVFAEDGFQNENELLYNYEESPDQLIDRAEDFDENASPITDSLDVNVESNQTSDTTLDPTYLGPEVIHVKIDVSMSYDSKQKQFKWNFDMNSSSKKPPMNVDFIITRSDFENGPYTRVNSLYVDNVSYTKNYVVNIPANTGHYQVKADIKARKNSDTIFSPVYGRKILLNKTGKEWTFYFSDSTSGKTLDKPPAYYPKSQIHQRPSNLNKTYKEWYDKTYNTNLDLTGYDVHHKRPLAYGGDNSMSNLIHLPRALHQSVTGWFNGY